MTGQYMDTYAQLRADPERVKDPQQVANARAATLSIVQLKAEWDEWDGISCEGEAAYWEIHRRGFARTLCPEI